MTTYANKMRYTQQSNMQMSGVQSKDVRSAKKSGNSPYQHNLNSPELAQLLELRGQSTCSKGLELIPRSPDNTQRWTIYIGASRLS